MSAVDDFMQFASARVGRVSVSSIEAAEMCVELAALREVEKAAREVGHWHMHYEDRLVRPRPLYDMHDAIKRLDRLREEKEGK